MRKLLALSGALCVIFFSSILIKAGVVNISPADFAAEGRSDDYIVAWGGWGDYLYRKTGATDDYAIAPLDIPDSVLIRYVRFHYLDNDASNDIFMCIVRSNKYTGAHNVIYNYTTTGASASITYATDFSASPSPSYALTNVEACSYQADVRIYGEGETYQKVYGMTIVYDPYP
jgi:hypothetical protein